MKTTRDPSAAFSAKARTVFLKREGHPRLRSDWTPALFLHFEVPPFALQPAVPHPLDCYGGNAFVSLVAFSFTNFRVRGLGPPGAAALRPFLQSHFLNVRTYVRGPEGPGIFFLREFLSNPLSVFLGPPTFGLPYRNGKLRYEADPKLESFRAKTRLEGQQFNFAASRQPSPWSPTHPGSLAEFLLERYVAYTVRRGKPSYFRIWHEPWRQTACQVELPCPLPAARLLDPKRHLRRRQSLARS